MGAAVARVNPNIEPVNAYLNRQVENEQPCINRCGSVAVGIINVASEARGKISLLTKAAKIGMATVSGLSVVCKSEALTNFSGKLDNYEGATDAFQLLDDADYVFSRRTMRDENGRPVLDAQGNVERSSQYVQDWKNAPAQAVFRTGLIAANVGSVALFTDAVGVTNNASIGQKIAEKIPAFGVFLKIGLLNIVRGLVAFAFTFLAIDAVIRLVKASDFKEKMSAILDLVWAVAEVALKIFMIVGGIALIGGTAGILVGAALSFLAAGIGLTAGIYKIVAEKQAKEAKINNNTAAAA